MLIGNSLRMTKLSSQSLQTLETWVANWPQESSTSLQARSSSTSSLPKTFLAFSRKSQRQLRGLDPLPRQQHQNPRAKLRVLERLFTSWTDCRSQSPSTPQTATSAPLQEWTTRCSSTSTSWRRPRRPTQWTSGSSRELNRLRRLSQPPLPERRRSPRAALELLREATWLHSRMASALSRPCSTTRKSFSTSPMWKARPRSWRWVRRWSTPSTRERREAKCRPRGWSRSARGRSPRRPARRMSSTGRWWGPSGPSTQTRRITAALSWPSLRTAPSWESSSLALPVSSIRKNCCRRETQLTSRWTRVNFSEAYITLSLYSRSAKLKTSPWTWSRTNRSCAPTSRRSRASLDSSPTSRMRERSSSSTWVRWRVERFCRWE